MVQVGTPKLNEMKLCELDTFRAWLGLRHGGSQAFILLCLMVGGDYNDGVDRIGPTSALQFIRHLLEGQADDNEIMLLLSDNLQAFQAGPKELAVQCTGQSRRYDIAL